MKQEHILLRSGALNLEGCLVLPARTGPGAGVVLCHPHPLYGGCMENNVIHALSRALVEKGIAALRFNFRGVGRSEGAHGGGRGEIDDVLAAVAFIGGRSEIDPEQVGLAGYSFGATVALGAVNRSDRIRAVAAISPPEIPDPDAAARPSLILGGSEDTLVPASVVLRQRDEIAGREGTAAVEIITGADHFWYGYEKALAGRVSSFFQQHLLL